MKKFLSKTRKQIVKFLFSVGVKPKRLIRMFGISRATVYRYVK